MVLFVFLLFLFCFIMVVFFSNFDIVPIFIFQFRFDAPKSLILLVGLLSGAFFISVWNSLSTISYMRVYREFSKKIQEMEEEIKKKDSFINELKSELKIGLEFKQDNKQDKNNQNPQGKD